MLWLAFEVGFGSIVLSEGDGSHNVSYIEGEMRPQISYLYHPITSLSRARDQSMA